MQPIRAHAAALLGGGSTLFATLLYAALVLTGTGARSLPAQGKFTNLETPHVKPIATATLVSGTVTRTVILVCNSADNSVEIYDAQAPHAFLQRVPVGIGPATVRWNPTTGSFYTCNFDGDSVSRVELKLVSQGGALVPFGSLVATKHVGDQPADIAFDPTGLTGSVTISGRSELVFLDSRTLNIQLSNIPLTAEEPTVTALAPGASVAPKSPRQHQILADGRSFALNFMGDTLPLPGVFPLMPPQADVDLWFHDPLNPPAAGFGGRHMRDLGTANQAFAINATNDTMVVVGTKARNLDVSGEANVAALKHGFVESHMWVVDIPAGLQPSVRAEAPAGSAPPTSLLSRNLNRDYSTISGSPVSHARSLSQPSDVALLEGGNGDIERIAITAFHSDTVTILTVSPTTFGGYIENQIPIPVSNPGLGYSTAGPSGIVFEPTTGLLYVTCRLDSSLRVIDPSTNTLVTTIQLNNDPTPNYIRTGRRFLYDAKFSSTSGFVSCASCHVNGTTDGLQWDLGDPGSTAPVPVQLEGQLTGHFTNFPADKGPMMTQTLQGLVNYEVNDNAQYMFTNAPYHWRGDREGFEDFNGAFVALLGRTSQLTAGEMFQYKKFINSIVHPPNSRQPIQRTVEGTLGPDPDDPFNASGSKLGLQLFHNFPTDDAQHGGCVGCHTLPEGSDNTLTEGFPVFSGPHPLETAALRNLEPREAIRHQGTGFSGPGILISNAGLTHDGISIVDLAHASIEAFCNSTVFTYPGTSNDRATMVSAISKYTREFDFGLAPAAGLSFTLDPGSPFNGTAMGFFQNQVAEANIGLAVIVRTGQAYRGFYFDTSVSPARYREEGTTNLFTQAAIEAMASAPNSVVVLQGTALGNERRVASPTGIGTTLSDLNSPPANLTAEPMAPMTYHLDIPKFLNNLRIDQAAAPMTITTSAQKSLWALRKLQLSALNNFGVDSLHHEPPRRFRITGDNIRAGAKLLVAIPTTNAGAVPVEVLELDLFPTAHTTNGKRIWETEEELGPIATFAMLNGGPFAPDVLQTVYRLTTTPALDPLTWNKFAFGVVNEDGTTAWTSFVPLHVQDVR